MKQTVRRPLRRPALRYDTAGSRLPSAPAQTDAHLGATEDQVVPTLPPGAGPRSGAQRGSSVSRALDPSKEITPG